MNSPRRKRLQENLALLLAQTKRTLRRFRISPLRFSSACFRVLLALLLVEAMRSRACAPRFGIQTFSWLQAGVS